MAFNGGRRSHHQHIAGPVEASAALAPVSITPSTGTGTAARIASSAKRRGGVAGDHQVIRLLLIHQKVSARDRVTRDRGLRLGSIGKAGSVAKVGIVRPGQALEQRAQDSEASKAGIEDADVHVT